MKLKMLMLIKKGKLFHHHQVHLLKIQPKIIMLFLVDLC
jgi:hypothetical protein